MIYIFGGGTISFIRNHMALCAPAFGTTARVLSKLMTSNLILTKMADYNSDIVTNLDIENKIKTLLEDPQCTCIILNAALCDYDGKIGNVESGSHAQRLETREGLSSIEITPSKKIISIIKESRPDILVIGFKTTTNANFDTMKYKSKRMNVDIVLANDTVTRKNIIFTSENSISCENREDSMNKLVNEISKLIPII